MLGSEALFRSLSSEALEQEGGNAARSSPSAATAITSALLSKLTARMKQEGYHPELGGSSYSVIMTREEKLQKVYQLRCDPHLHPSLLGL